MIWVIAGTENGKNLVECLLEDGYQIIATTATDYGKKLLKENTKLTILSKPLSYEDMIALVKKYNINFILDASHPFAEEVSKNAVLIAKNFAIPYIRYERKELNYSSVNNFDSYESAVNYLKNTKGKILLTIGVKNLELFSIINKKRIFVKILSHSQSVLECEKLGYLPDHIIAMKGTYSKDFNKALFKELSIDYLVTKESGIEGGTKDKIDAANELGVEVVLIKRPQISYPEVLYELEDIKEKLRNHDGDELHPRHY
jgi:precorrin-6A/cobalt-precorrin-6A reductase